jgi:transposase-like protein
MPGVLRPPAERARLVAAYRGSGVSARVFAEREGVALSTLYQWLTVFATPSPPAPRTLRLARVVRRSVASAALAARPTVAVEVAGLRVHVATGFDPALLNAVLDVLAARERRETP